MSPSSLNSCSQKPAPPGNSGAQPREDTHSWSHSWQDQHGCKDITNCAKPIFTPRNSEHCDSTRCKCLSELQQVPVSPCHCHNRMDLSVSWDTAKVGATVEHLRLHVHQSAAKFPLLCVLPQTKKKKLRKSFPLNSYLPQLLFKLT